MESRMNNANISLKSFIQPGTTRDLSFLGLVVIFVFSSMPVTIMGSESPAEYFFAERNTKVIQSVRNCLNPHQPCTVDLEENSHLSVMMPALVSIADDFDVSAKIKGVAAERVTVTFNGVTHSHGLLPQTMKETKPNDFRVKGHLSFCGYKKMDWLALVTVYTERTVYEASFSFESVDSRVDEVKIEQTPLASL